MQFSFWLYFNNDDGIFVFLVSSSLLSTGVVTRRDFEFQRFVTRSMPSVIIKILTKIRKQCRLQPFFLFVGWIRSTCTTIAIIADIENSIIVLFTLIRIKCRIMFNSKWLWFQIIRKMYKDTLSTKWNLAEEKREHNV